MGAQRLVAAGQVVLGASRRDCGTPPTGCRCDARAARRRATKRVLQALGQGDEALAAEHDMGVLEAGEGQAEVIEPVIERRAGDGDAEIAHVGEVRQPEPTGLMGLAEDHLLLRAMQRPPGADAALQRAADAGAELADGGAASPRRARSAAGPGAACSIGTISLSKTSRQRIGPPPPARGLLLRGQSRVLLEAIAGRGAERRPWRPPRARVSV